MLVIFLSIRFNFACIKKIYINALRGGLFYIEDKLRCPEAE